MRQDTHIAEQSFESTTLPSMPPTTLARPKSKNKRDKILLGTSPPHHIDAQSPQKSPLDEDDDEYWIDDGLQDTR